VIISFSSSASTVYSAALDAHRRGNNSLPAVALLQEMRARHLQPTAGHYNLVLRTLRAEVSYIYHNL
jgi:hypothetical protein